MGREFTIRRSDGVREFTMKKKNDRLRVYHEKEQWGKNSP